MRPLFELFFFLSILPNKPSGQWRGFVCVMLFGADGYFWPPLYHLLLAEGHASHCPTYNLLEPEGPVFPYGVNMGETKGFSFGDRGQGAGDFAVSLT